MKSAKTPFVFGRSFFNFYLTFYKINILIMLINKIV